MIDPDKGKYGILKDEHLMKAIHRGDTGAFNELYVRYNKRLLYFFYRMLGNSNEKARDFLQDIFVKIIERPELFDSNRKFSTWIFSVAHNMCKNEYRRMSVRNIMVSNDRIDQFAEVSDDRLCNNQITADQIYTEIDNLGDTEKTVFILYYREDFTLQEIGKVLSLPEGTVKSKLFYTRKKLSNILRLQEVK
jgi:RNA polymerase sigma-70 factor (ECF subfamily)